MSTDINLKELWSKQSSQQPKIEELLSKFATIKRKNLTKLIAANILMFATITFVIFIWLYFQPKLITTKIGIVVMVLAITLFMIFYNQLIPYLKKINENQNNNEFLNALIALKEKQKFLQTKISSIYFVALTVGLCLYLYEYAMQMPFSWSILTYLITLIWIAFNWFYLRPRIVSREREKLDKIIKKLECIREQQ